MPIVIKVDHIVVSEANTHAVFTVRLSEADLLNPVTVNWNLTGLSAVSGNDFTNVSGVLTFNPGVLEQVISIPIVDNATPELLETFRLNLFSPSANAQIGNSIAVVTIIDNDAAPGTPVVTINDFVVDEAAKEASFVITLDRPSTGVVSMNYATQDGTAIAGSDFVATSGSLSFAVGETARTVQVSLLNDSTPESSEAFNLVLSALNGATTLDPVGTAIIAENDAVAVATSNISVDDIVVGESQTYADFLVRLDQPNTATVKVSYALLGASASGYGTDFHNQSGDLTFAPGETVKTVRATITNDSNPEPTENFVLLLSNPSSNATLARPVATATIIDNDAAPGTPVVRIGDAVVDEASGLVQVAVILDRPSLGDVTVNYAVQAATAGAGSDFTAFPASVVGFAPGETVKLVTVGIRNDNAPELTEVFDVAITSAVGAIVGDGTGHVFINRNDSTPVASPVLDLRNVVTVEGHGYVDFLITLSAPSSSSVKVNYQTTGGTAAGYGTDFTNQSGALTFSPGETIKTVRVTTTDDGNAEGQETFSLQSYSPTNATLGNAVATATILDNDSAPPGAPVVLNGTTAADILRGSPFDDAITGGDGNDVLEGAGGNDTLTGGAGDDLYLIEDAGDSCTEAVGGGSDLVISYLPSLALGANIEDLQLAGSAVTGIGNSLDNRITGSAESNILEGGLGDDTLDGGAGTDTASYAAAAGGVVVTLAVSGVPQDTVSAGLDTLLSIENLTGSDFNDKLTGDTNANTLTGGLGNDTLNGGTGADTMIGGDGSDLYYVDNAGDVVSETNAAAAGGTDLVNTLVNYTLGANVENLRITASGAVNGTGNALNNVIYAGAGDNVLDGGAGTDTLSYAYATAGVTVSLATVTPQVTGGSGTDTVLNFENLTG
ncbi:MAG: hypothetical protein DVS81_09535, partial [Candidatus Accumulibacter meliphilus]